MKIILYHIDCEAREMGKAYYLEHATLTKSIDGTLREQCSLVAPSITFAQTISVLSNYNYAYIEAFNRYYFITDITSIRDSLTRIDFKCDVLFSFRKNVISADSLLFCERWSGSDDKLINDEMRDYESNKTITEVRADTLTTSGVTLDNWEEDWNYLKYNYALSIVQNKGYGGSLNVVQLPTLLSRIVPDLFPENYNGNDFLSTFACSSSYINSLLVNFATQKTEVENAIISIDSYPFNLYQKSEFTSITIGTTSITGIGTCYLTEPRAQLLADFTPIKSSEELDYNTMKTKYELWLPFDKWITLNPEEIRHDRVLVYYVPIFMFRQCNIYVITATGKLLYTNTVSICNPIPINSSNAQQIRDNYIQTLIGAGTGLISTAIGATTGNPYMVTRGIGELSGTATKLVSTALTSHLTMSTTTPNGNSGINSARHVIFRITRPNPVVLDDEDAFTDYRNNFGLPYMRTIAGDFLSKNTGTFSFGECKIKFNGATKGEIEEMKSILRQGITNTYL